VSVTVDRAAAASVANIILRLCYDDRCKDVRVDHLYPGSDTVPQGCPTVKNPNTSCSATAVPNGTKVGFVEVADLPEGTIRASATMTVNGNARKLSQIEVQATVVHPNGPSCPGTANQAKITVGAGRLTAP
jgi:hypothetical protein